MACLPGDSLPNLCRFIKINEYHPAIENPGEVILLQ